MYYSTSPSKGAQQTLQRRNPVHSSTTQYSPLTNGQVPPMTAVEQYWAARALKAEALLSARETHHQELKILLQAEEDKRAKEMARLAEQHHAKHAGLERLTMALLACLCALVILVIYLATHDTRNAPQKSRGWLPSHFTIPIFSPFTSVVEHETSVVGTKTIAIVCFISAGLAYFVYRHRFSHVQR